MHAASAGLKSDVSTINASRAIDGIPALFAPDVMLMMVSVGGEFRGFAYGPLPLISQNEAKTGIIEHENARLKELLEEANSRAEAWHDKYNRDVEGVNNEGDAIGGEPPFGLRHAVDYFKAECDRFKAELAVLRGEPSRPVTAVAADATPPRDLYWTGLKNDQIGFVSAAIKSLTSELEISTDAAYRDRLEGALAALRGEADADNCTPTLPDDYVPDPQLSAIMQHVVDVITTAFPVKGGAR